MNDQLNYKDAAAFFTIVAFGLLLGCLASLFIISEKTRQIKELRVITIKAGAAYYDTNGVYTIKPEFK